LAEKKITRKELLKEPDEFLTLTGKSIVYFRKHPRQVTIAGVVLAVCVVVGAGIYSYNNYREKQSHEVFQRAAAAYHSLVQSDENVNPEKLDYLFNTFEQAAKTYPSMPAGEQALLYTGHILFKKKDYKGALERYNQMQSTSLVKKGLGQLVLYHIGRTRLALDDYEQAVLIFDQLSKDTNSPYRREAYASIARIYELMNKNKEAVQAYRQYLKIFPEAPDAAFVRARIADLSAQG